MHKVRWVINCLLLITLTAACLAQSAPDMSTLFARLDDLRTTDQATQQILEAATKDSSVREDVVQRLSQIIDRPKTNKIWLNAVRLAGELKASETIPSLQKALSRGRLGGLLVYSMTAEMQLDDDAIGKALSRIGDAAIPTVRELLGSQDPKDRRRAVLILRNMGSPGARKVLQDHLSHETDATNKELIEAGLRPSK